MDEVYRSITVTGRGGLEAVRVVERDRRPPAAGEVRVRVLASAVCQDDVAIRVGNRPFLRNPPHVPGYSFIGVVEALGAGGHRGGARTAGRRPDLGPRRGSVSS